ncbi:MAG: GNAT family N-acetyltransferase [Nitrososphaerota archaeon]|nr:GNAT family N-acetyltransferase [Nitrososphaerota archaeon]
MGPIVRRARPSDKEPLMSFIKDVWGGHDYIPSVWDEWVRDETDMMYVVELDGVPVGMNRLRFLDDSSAWFEGVRVHPLYRGRGLATLLGENSMDVARRRGVKVFRLTSGSRNKTAHRQIARIGFSEVARFSVYKLGKATPSGSGAEQVGIGALDEAAEMVRGSPEFKAGHGVYWHNWGAAVMTPEVIRRLVEQGAVWRLGGAVAVAGLGSEGRDGWEEVGFIGGEPADAVMLARFILGGRKDAAGRWVFVPQGSPIVHALRTSGFRRHFSNILFERKAAKG